jgi:hypothetical protein
MWTVIVAIIGVGLFCIVPIAVILAALGACIGGMVGARTAAARIGGSVSD